MSLHFRIFWVHFFHVPFFDLIHWFWPKTTWEAHPSGFLGPKRCILDFSKKKSEKSSFFSEKMKMDQKWSKNPEKVRNSFQAWFPIIFIIWTHKIQNFGILGHFAPFFVIFGVPPFTRNLRGKNGWICDFSTESGYLHIKLNFEAIKSTC